MTTNQNALGNLRYLLLGFVSMTVGISLISSAAIGTTPISTLPLTVTAITGLSFGVTTILLNCLFVLIQKALLGNKFSALNWLQIPLVLVFGLFLDLGMWVWSHIAFDVYWEQCLYSMLGNVFLGLGVTLEIRSRSIPLPGEGLVIALALRFQQKFSNLKIANDLTMVALAALLGWVALGKIVTIGEGTLVSAIVVGLFVKAFSRVFDALGIFKMT